MSRVQLALNVSDLEAAIEFYAKLFSSPPSKVHPGYANVAITNPPLKLVLIETPGDRGGGLNGALNHLGVEVDTPEEVLQTQSRLAAEGLTTREEHEISCCYAIQDKVWVEDPDGAPWEVYAVLADVPDETGSGGTVEGACCQPLSAATPVSTACC